MLRRATQDEDDMNAPDERFERRLVEETSKVRVELAGVEVRLTDRIAQSEGTLRQEISGVDVRLTGDGREAVESFKAGHFDLILMDVQMPVMNGVDATHASRKIEAERGLPAIPILALSANVMRHQIEE